MSENKISCGCASGTCLFQIIWAALVINTVVWGAKIGVNQAQLSNARAQEKPKTEIQKIAEKCDRNLSFKGWFNAIPNSIKGR